MRLQEALKISQAHVPDGAPVFSIALICGFTPDHFGAFLNAHLRRRRPDRSVEIRFGLFGDPFGSLERLAEEDAPDAVVLPIEWTDLDGRLGLRQLGGWLPDSLPDILRTVETRLSGLRAAVSAASRSLIVLSMPTLPLPPVSHLAPRQAGAFEMRLRELLAATAADLATIAQVRLINPEAIDRESPLGERLDVRSELVYGFPYRAGHASALAGLMARLIDPPGPKKGLITDLDDTLWKGLVGEIGASAISWDLDSRSHGHALYQQMLRSLAAAGVLIAVASKNEPDRVKEAFLREDLILGTQQVFPFEVGWGPKSAAVSRILKAWNVAPDSVVFVDDSPLELGEVAASHPEVEGVLFPKGDEAGIYALLERLRDSFGKPSLSTDDAIRLESLRRAADGASAAKATAGSEDFLATIGAVLTISLARDPSNLRPLELVNKTNQFNLNGRRISDSAWLARLADPDRFVLAVGYRDKFGPLGTIAVASGKVDGATLLVDTWVMSCRAFSRRIEHRILRWLFERFDADEVALDFEPTPKNNPFRDFLARYPAGGQEAGAWFRIGRADADAAQPSLYHSIEETTDG